MPHPIITVSRQLGSGGTELAELVADRLGYTLFDKEVIDVVAREAGVQREIVEGLDERTRNGIEQWVDGVLHRRIVTSQDFVRSLVKVLITVARTGSAVVVGRGANFILAGEPALHVRVVAGEEYRLRRLMRIQGIDRKEAGPMLEKADRERSEFVQRYLHRGSGRTHRLRPGVEPGTDRAGPRGQSGDEPLPGPVPAAVDCPLRDLLHPPRTGPA